MPIPLAQFPGDEVVPHSTPETPRILFRMLTPWQLKTLAVLSRAVGPMTRTQIHETCMRYGVGNRFPVGVSEAVGQSDPIKRAAGDKKRGKPSLLTLQYVTESKYDIEGSTELGLTITDLGRSVLAMAEQRLVNMGKGTILPSDRPVSTADGDSDRPMAVAARCY